jgi:hypothetical protein
MGVNIPLRLLDVLRGKAVQSVGDEVDQFADVIDRLPLPLSIGSLFCEPCEQVVHFHRHFPYRSFRQAAAEFRFEKLLVAFRRHGLTIAQDQAVRRWSFGATAMRLRPERFAM